MWIAEKTLDWSDSANLKLDWIAFLAHTSVEACELLDALWSLERSQPDATVRLAQRKRTMCVHVYIFWIDIVLFIFT